MLVWLQLQPPCLPPHAGMTPLRSRPVPPQLWMEMFEPPSEGELEMVEEVLKSWFMVGRLGGYNGMNLQVSCSSCTPPGDAAAQSVRLHRLSVLYTAWCSPRCALRDNTGVQQCRGRGRQLPAV